MIDPTLLSRWMFEKHSIWQLNLLNPQTMSNFLRLRKVDLREDQILQLWQLGWVRADLIKGSENPMIQGVDILEKNEHGESLYADNRILCSTQLSINAPVWTHVENFPDLVPLFHPFKFYVFWHLYQKMQVGIHRFQIFNPDAYDLLLKQSIDFFYRWIQSNRAETDINHWDEVTRLSIATEPCYYPQIIGSLTHPPQIQMEEQLSDIQAYRSMLKDHYLHTDLDSIKDILGELCVFADILEPNRNIHSLIRFIKGNERKKIKGDLGGAVLLKTMAKVIRRMAEYSFGIQLPEEDEMGSGLWIEGSRERLYGTSRIFDYGSLAKRHYVREMGLDTEVRTHIYVEGQTEYGAFSYFLKDWWQIEIFDLKGQFLQSRRKGLAFHENLILDDNSQVFSIIFLDGDIQDNINVVKEAAEKDLFCGPFYISQPDFEFGNFSLSELVEIAWMSLDEIDRSSENLQKLSEALKDINCSDDYFVGVRSVFPKLTQFRKGLEWGETLAKFAAKYPEINGTEVVRPFITAVNVAIQSITSNYRFSRINTIVDPKTGKIVRR